MSDLVLVPREILLILLKEVHSHMRMNKKLYFTDEDIHSNNRDMALLCEYHNNLLAEKSKP